ncbi:MAG: riboflavin synthase [Candidatus Margulisbacteria bacterium]|nr:riboflavin synthase [Candidatus Margulisiibacteriota bacterium]
MFTGIVQKKGIVKVITKSEGYSSLQVSVESDFLKLVVVGDSVAVNGVCLTVNKNGGSFFQADVMNETLIKSNMSKLKVGEKVNLEKAARMDSFLGGHIVQGHVDGMATLNDIKALTNQWIISFSVGEAILKELFSKASIALNGISLTVLDVTRDSFSVSIIPSTYQKTNFSLLQKGDFVNIETDILGKYVVNYLENRNKSGSLTKGFLSEHGF